ncbi:MAG: hypothetical protein Q8P59_13795 [Dehalococcoidia bacterium]|nr:hypothetical protein [Dehalococcoidia bacterium]
MEPLAILVVLIALAAAVYFWQRATRAGEPKGGDVAPAKSVANLEPGDGLSFWDGQNCLVENVLDCTEQVGARTIQWQWVVLNDGRLLEIAPDGNMAYGAPDILQQGSAAFEQLTGDQGVLKTFEQRVREGVAGSQVVHFRHGRTNYQVKSTGTFSAGIASHTLTQEVLRDVSPQAGDNVYFEMESASGVAALGVWTTHIAWYVGQPLKESDIVNIYPKGKEARN